MSELKVNKVTPRSGTTVTLGDSGDTITIPSGATIDLSSATQTGVGGTNTPAFFAKKVTSQTLTHNAYTKIQFESEDFDTNSAYDNSVNYRFTVPAGQGGKYCIFSQLTLDSNGTGSDYIILTIYKNGSRIFASNFFEGGLDLDEPTVNIKVVLDLAATNYIEIFGTMAIGSGSPTIKLTADNAYLNYFGAYKLI